MVSLNDQSTQKVSLFWLRLYLETYQSTNRSRTVDCTTPPLRLFWRRPVWPTLAWRRPWGLIGIGGLSAHLLRDIGLSCCAPLADPRRRALESESTRWQ